MKTALKMTNVENIGAYMKSPVRTIPAESTLREFLKQLKEDNVGSLIVNKNDEHVGIATKWDFIRKAITKRMNPETTPVSEIMDGALLTLERSIPLEEARAFMVKHKIRHVPVKEENQIVGMLSFKDTIRKTVDQKLIDSFTQSTTEAIQNFMLDASPLPPTESGDLPGDISSIIKLTDEARNVEIIMALNFSEEISRKIYRDIFGEEPESIRDVCNVVAEIGNVMAGNVTVEISHMVKEILTLTHSEQTSKNAKGRFHFDLSLPTTIIGSEHSVFGAEKLSTTKTFIPFKNEGTHVFLLGLIFQKMEDN